MEILVYVTDDKERVLGGDPLTLYMANDEKRQDFLFNLSEMMHAQIVQMNNGDHMIIKNRYA